MDKMTDKCQRLRLDQIQVRRPDRQRRDLEIDQGLLDSIKARGVYNPIIVRQDHQDIVLVAGERRLEASRQLGLADILVRFADTLSPIESRIIELEENLKRRDLEWKDYVRSLVKIHQLHKSQDEDWTMGETASSISIHPSEIVRALRVNGEPPESKVWLCDGLREAYNLLARRDQRLEGEALQELLETPEPSPQTDQMATDEAQQAQDGDSTVRVLYPVSKPRPDPEVKEDSIIHVSFLDWIQTYEGPKFNLVHCDFPYGIGIFQSKQGRGIEPTAGYQDDEQVYLELLESFCKNLDRFMSVSAHLMFWYSARPGSKRERVTREMFQKLAPSLDFEQFPLVWLKSDNAGISGDPRRMPRHVYETCLLASRGKRQIVKVAADAYAAPTDKRLHPSCKPEPMLRHFMQMFVDESTRFLDPTCGSASALRAAESLGAKSVLGLEKDLSVYQLAKIALENARVLRVQSKQVGL